MWIARRRSYSLTSRSSSGKASSAGLQVITGMPAARALLNAFRTAASSLGRFTTPEATRAMPLSRNLGDRLAGFGCAVPREMGPVQRDRLDVEGLQRGQHGVDRQLAQGVRCDAEREAADALGAAAV